MIQPPYTFNFYNQFCVPTLPIKYTIPSNGLLSVASLAKLKVEIWEYTSPQSSTCLYVAFCPAGGTLQNIRVNQKAYAVIHNIDKHGEDVHLSVVADRPQIALHWNS